MSTRLALTLVPVCLVAATPADPGPRSTRVEKGLLPQVPVAGDAAWTLAERMAHHKVPGVSVAVMDHFRVVWTKGYGFADVAAKRPVTPRTRFLAGSVSKPVAAMGALKLVQGGRLALDADINTELKSWKLPSNEFTAKTPVTLRLLMSHSAGLTVHGFDGYEVGATLPTLPQILDGAPPANSAPVRVDLAPDTQYRYSGGGITLEQLAMSDATGESFPALMDRLVLSPLGMGSSTYVQPDGDDPGLPTGYRSNGSPVKGRYHRYPEMAAAGLWTTPGDLLKAALEIPAALAGRGHVLSAASARMMLSPRFAVSPDGGASIGLGFFVSRRGNESYYGHDGADEGFQCLLIANPRTGQGAAVMTNSDNGVALAQEIVQGIAAEYHWAGFEAPLPTVPLEPGRAAGLAGRYRLNGDAVLEFREKEGRLSLQDHGDVPLHALTQNLLVRTDATLRYRFEDGRVIEIDRGRETSASRMPTGELVPSELLASGRIEEAVAGYRALRAAQPADPGIQEVRLNLMGYGFLGRGQMPQALAVFGVNAEFHPESCNTWDSLGEAQVAAGEREKARASYRKALEVLPRDPTTPPPLKETVRADATAALQKLGAEP